MIEGILTWLGTSADEFIGGAVLWLLDLLISLLPLSPFIGINIDGLPAHAIGWLNWLVDIRGMMGLMGAWLACVMIYMVLHKILEVVNDAGITGLIGHIINPISGDD